MKALKALTVRDLEDLPEGATVTEQDLLALKRPDGQWGYVESDPMSSDYLDANYGPMYRVEEATEEQKAKERMKALTIQDLAALPVGSVVLDNVGTASQKRADGRWGNQETINTSEELVDEYSPVYLMTAVNPEDMSTLSSGFGDVSVAQFNQVLKILDLYQPALAVVSLHMEHNRIIAEYRAVRELR